MSHLKTSIVGERGECGSPTGVETMTPESLRNVCSQLVILKPVHKCKVSLFFKATRQMKSFLTRLNILPRQMLLRS